MQSGSFLLKHLRTEGDPQREAVREAEVISVWGSPSGLVWQSDISDCFLYPDGTRPPTKINRRDMEPFAQVWRDILSEIKYLRNGQPTALRTRDLEHLNDRGVALMARVHHAAGHAELTQEGAVSE